MPRSSAAAFVLIACGFAATGPAHAVGWRHRLDARTVDVAVQRTSANANGQFWVVGAGAASLVLARYDDGTVPVLTLALPQDVIDFDAMRTTPHGDLVATRFDASPSTRCTIVKYFSDGRRRWSQTLPDCGGGASTSSRIHPASDDGEWIVLPTQSIKLSADGRVLERIAAASFVGEVEAIDPRSDTLFAAGVRADGSGVVAAYDRRGVERWRTNVATPVRIAVADDGSLRVAGNGNARFVAAIGPGGVPRWSTPVGAVAPGGSSLAAPLVDADGATLVAAGDDAAVKIDANGRVAWRVRRDAIEFPPAPTAFDASLAPNGDLVLAYGDRVVRVDANGGVRYIRRVGPGGASPHVGIAAFDKDGAAIVTVRETQPPRTALARIGVNGGDLAAPAPPSWRAPAATPSRALLPDGSTVAWTYASGARELLRIDAHGKPLWRRATLDANGSDDGYADAIAADAARVCILGTAVAGRTVVACYRSGDGEPLWSRTLDGDASGTRARLHIAADGGVAAWYGAAVAGTSLGRVAQVRFERDGRVLAATSFDDAALADTLPSDAPFALVTNAGDAFVVDAAGAERYRIAVFPEQLRGAGFDTDGGLVATLDDASAGGAAVRYDAQGRRRWSSTLPAGADASLPVVDRNAVYLANCCDASSQYRVARLALTDGTITWQRRVALSPDAAPRAPMLAAAPDGEAIVAVGAPGHTLDVDAFATRDGAPRGRLRERCDGPACVVAAPLVGDGGVHVVEVGVGGASSLVGLPLPGAQPPVRIDQLGLTGAWWSPYADGEGFVLDYLPDSRTLFMPWFTYARDGDNDPSGLRWYAVQGRIEPNATSSELVISEATGGAFDAGPIVAAKRAGTATLTFTDCDNGTLTYAFDDGGNRGARGSITLARLSPATEPCVLADGTVRPGAGARPYANGFDARMSGSWFEPATSGQGLQFVVQPGAFLFVPWFTYDPADSADDPGAQRWFTLQGSLERARDGVVEVPIVQTIGGAFDRVPTNNASIVGKATLRMLACDRARLDYRFDDSDVAGAMRSRAGSMDLDKIGGCAQR